MRVIIFSNGQYQNEEFYRKQLSNFKKATIIAADGGANFLRRIDILPDYLIGDMDSVLPENLTYFEESKLVKIEKYPVMKDETDTEIAIQKAVFLKAEEIILFGGLGERLDHSLGNIYLLSRLLNKKITGRIINEEQEIRMIDSLTCFSYPEGTIFSILPIDGEAGNINVEGFRYPIINGTMTIEKPYGISNVTSKDRQIVDVKQGKLLIIIGKSEEEM